MKTQIVTQKLILGSGSTYRRQLLSRLQIPFETVNSQIDETPLHNELPQESAIRLAEEKARAVARSYPQSLIIGSDQVAVLGNYRLNKPLTHNKAVEQLKLVRGQQVIFYTALCLLNNNTHRLQKRIVTYTVKFRENYSDQQIENYLNKEQPYDCAGSAKFEGLGIVLIERMTGDDPNALIGLPLIALIEMLADEGIEVI